MTNKVLVVAVTALLAWPLTVAAEQPAAPGGNSAAADQKVIQDPAEFNAYMAALQQSDPEQRAAAMEAFVTQYPNSVMKIEALEQAMAAYQQADNLPKVGTSANRILQIEPDNVRALAIVTFVKRTAAGQGDPAAAAAAAADAERGLKALPHWPMPSGMSSAEFTKVRSQMTVIFDGAIGFAALQAKDYGKARDHYRKSVAIDPNNLQDVFQLAITELEMSPLDTAGFWHVARAMKLAAGNPSAQQTIASYGKPRYSKYHGGDDGWDALIAQADKQADLPPGFAVKPAQ